jgi:formate/nitrite transporter FocA (FNT family)
MKPEFMDVLMRGILAGWIIALMVWVLPGADAFERSFVIVVLTYIVGVAKLSHIIAGSVDTMYLAFTGDISWAAYATGFLVPSLIGNTIGGVTLTAAINHAQVATGED